MLLIKNATIVHPDSKLNGKKRDLLIAEGKIVHIKTKIEAPNAEILEAKGVCVSVGWLDLGVQVGDPGFEHRETLASASAAAAAGGFTAIACQPNAHPVVHSKSEVLYLRRHAAQELVDFYPIGAISQNCEGIDITEMYDMSEAGAIAFSDGQKPVQHAGLLMRALQYVKAFDGLIINHPHDKSLAPAGQMHEGTVSTSLGMRGFPTIAEELMLQRDLYLLEYTDSRLHAANISTAGAVAQLRKAKARGLALSSSVAVMNLIADDTAL
ncbi:MAG: dihydroorotase, partial [Bacteroidota bacterium]